MRPPAPSYDGRIKKAWGAGNGDQQEENSYHRIFSPKGRELFKDRGDIEIVEFPNMISAVDFEAMLREHAPVHGVALGATRFGEPELEASGDMKVVTRIGVGYDAVDVPALAAARFH